MAKEVTNNTETQQVQIPMIVDLDAFDEHGLIMGVARSQIRKWKIGNRIVDVVLVPGTQEQYDSIMDEYYREFKAEDRDKRCSVPGKNGKLIRCPDERKCSECPYYLKREHYGTATFSDLTAKGDDGEEIEFEPESPENYCSGDRYLRMLDDLIKYAAEIDPEYGTMIQLLHDGMSRRQVAEALGIPKSTVIDRVAKLRKITDEFFDNLTY